MTTATHIAEKCILLFQRAALSCPALAGEALEITRTFVATTQTQRALCLILSAGARSLYCHTKDAEWLLAARHLRQLGQGNPETAKDTP